MPDPLKPVSPIASSNGAAALSTTRPRAHLVTFDIAPAALFKIVATVAIVYLFLRLLPVLVLLIFALMLVATFNPLVRRLEARFGRSWAIGGVVTLVIVVFLGVLAALIPVLLNQAFVLFQNAPRYARQIEEILVSHHLHLHLQKRVESIVSGSQNVPLPIFDIAKNLITGLTSFITVAILAIYLLIEGPQVVVFLMRWLPHEERSPVRKLATEIGSQVGGYMRGQIITSGLAGLSSFLILYLAGVPGALALGALAVIADVIPLIGLLVALIPAALMALTVSATKAGIVIACYLIYHQLEDHFIAPKVYGETLGLSLTVIVVSIMIGVELMGMTGAVLALPAAAIIRSLCAFYQKWQETHSGDEAGSDEKRPEQSS